MRAGHVEHISVVVHVWFSHQLVRGQLFTFQARGTFLVIPNFTLPMESGSRLS